jgi:hypothetical protein
MNVNIVLLNIVIEEEAYVKKPQGFEVYQKETLACNKARLKARGFSHKEGEYYDDNLFQ